MIPSLEQLRAGGKRALARALAAAEARLDDPGVAALLDQSANEGRARVLGVTGPPGVGKSSLISVLIRRLRARGMSVGVIAVDPSSKRSGGAVLGDRTRFETDPEDDVFVRSMAARARLGGLARETFAALALMRAVVDRVIVETVGVGQSETDVTQVADLVMLCIQPGSGDSLQYMKAGIAEVPDLAVVTKADLGALAGQARVELEAAWQLQEADRSPDIAVVSASAGTGLDELVARIEDRLVALDRLDERRAGQHRWWAEELLRERFGTAGVRLVRERLDGEGGRAPFQTMLRSAALLEARLNPESG